MTKNKYSKLIKRVIASLVIFTSIMVYGAILSGPNNPTANSVLTFQDSKTVKSTSVTIDSSGNVSANSLVLNGSLITTTTITFTNKAEMVASSYTNRIAYLTGNYHSNSVGNGFFRNTATAEGSTNFGTEIMSANGSYWHRIRDNTSVWRLDWFNVYPMNSDVPSTTHDSTLQISNCIATAGNYSKIIWPNFWVGGLLILSNAVGVQIEGERGSHGVNLSYPTKAPGLAYIGATNGTLIKMWNARECVIKGMGLDANTPINELLAPITNHALVLIDIDQVTPAVQISTHNLIENNYLRVRQTNVTFFGCRVAETSPNNCEQMIFRNNIVRGGAYYNNGLLDGSLASTANESTAFYIGNSPNARGWDFDNNVSSGCRYGYWIKNGGGIIRGGAKMGGLSEFDVRIDAWTWPITVEGIGTEASKHFALLGSGAGGYSSTTPITFINCASETSGIRHYTNPIVVVNGSATINMLGSMFGGATNQIIYQVSNIYTATLKSSGNSYPGTGFTGRGFDQFSYFDVNDTFLENSPDTSSTSTHFIKSSKDYRWNSTYLSNTLASVLLYNSLWLNPTNGSVLIGPVGPVEQSEKFGFHPGQASAWNWVWGDTGIVRRVTLAGDASVGSTTLNLFATNGSAAKILLTEYQGNDSFGVEAGFSRVDQWFSGAPYRFRNGGVNGPEVLLVSENAQITITSTNPTSGLTFNVPTSSFTGTVSSVQGFYRRISAKTGDYTLVIADDYVSFDGTTLTATLPSAVTMGSGKTFTIKNLNASTLTIATTSSQTIDGTTPANLTVGQSRTYLSNGSNWFIIGGYL